MTTKNIIVVGASQGIGKAICQYLNQNTQVRLIAIARNQEALRELAQNCPHPEHIHPLSFDLEHGNFDLLTQQINAIFKSTQILIYNAGMLINKAFDKLELNEVQKLFQINVFSAWNLIKHLHNDIAPSGHIVHIGSMGGFQGSAKFSGLSAYSASKAALACWSECLAEELKPQQIAVNCLCLGAVQTDMLRQAFPNFKAPVMPQDMARLISNFALTGHHFFNGKVLPVSVNTP